MPCTFDQLSMSSTTLSVPAKMRAVCVETSSDIARTASRSSSGRTTEFRRECTVSRNHPRRVSLRPAAFMTAQMLAVAFLLEELMALTASARLSSASHARMPIGCSNDERMKVGVEYRSVSLSGARMPRRTIGVSQPIISLLRQKARSGDQPYGGALSVALPIAPSAATQSRPSH